MKKFLLLFGFLITLAGQLMAQTVESPDMADPMRQSGKIYVVVGVIAIIFIGIIVYIIAVDSRLSRLEKLLRDKEDKK